MPRTPKSPAEPIIVTDRLPVICPACGHHDLGIIQFGFARVTCQSCNWSAKYQVKP